MKPLVNVTLLAMLLLSTGVASVAAAGYGPFPPDIHCMPYPICLPSTSVIGYQASGPISITYPDGTNVALSQSTVRLHVCSTEGCKSVTATLTPNAPGTYTYSFTTPSGVTGSATIILPAGSLTDTYGTTFPSVNTVIGTITVGSTGATTPAGPPASSWKAPSPSVMHTTQPLEQASQPQLSLLIPVLLALLSIVGIALFALPNKTA